MELFLISFESSLLATFSLSLMGCLTNFDNTIVRKSLLLSDPISWAPIFQDEIPKSEKMRQIVMMANSMDGVSMQRVWNTLGDIAYAYTDELEQKGVIKKEKRANGTWCVLLPKGQIWSAYFEIKEQKSTS
ncbi:MAG: hypothetical protein GWO20_01430 [Candidatus Korarchaeota archaeon]|nr:hypothetical protein [Candidatus Korarchaeota archaeon]NIU82185.1 hypothetical protein [Candidatus Thorarchaeota archaeon]NIW12653.1 hypothetical protein [Candidatus Thorarchaeota archaeon]NIW50860.1 hypothetical protein [Candidatus Korarchaeota archaeon]